MLQRLAEHWEREEIGVKWMDDDGYLDIRLSYTYLSLSEWAGRTPGAYADMEQGVAVVAYRISETLVKRLVKHRLQHKSNYQDTRDPVSH